MVAYSFTLSMKASSRKKRYDYSDSSLSALSPMIALLLLEVDYRLVGILQGVKYIRGIMSRRGDVKTTKGNSVWLDTSLQSCQLLSIIFIDQSCRIHLRLGSSCLEIIGKGRGLVELL